MIRWVFRLITLLTLLLALGVVFAPNLAATQWGKAMLLKLYRTMTGNTLSVEKIEASWWEGQHLEQVSFKDRTGAITLTAQTITTDTTLWQLLFYHNLGTVEIDLPALNVETDLQKKIAWNHAGFVPQMNTAIPFSFDKLTVKNGSALFFSPGIEPITLGQIVIDASTFQTQLKLEASGVTSQGSVEGRFQIAGSYTSLAQVELAATIENFPIRALDQLATISNPHMKGWISATMGEAITLELKIKNLPATFDLFCDATSPTFAAHFATQTHNNIVTLSSPATVTFQLPGQLLSTTQPLAGELKIDSLSLPLDDKESFSCQSTLKGSGLSFAWGQIDPFTLFISTENFKSRTFALKIDSKEIQLNSSLTIPDDIQQMVWEGQALFPANTRVDFSAQTLDRITATISGQQLEGTVQGSYDPHQQIVALTTPAKLLYNLPQLPAPLPPLLQQPLPVHLLIQPLKLSLLDLSGPLKAELQLDPFQLGAIQIDETTAEVNGEIKTRKGQFNLTSSLSGGQLKANGSIEWPSTVVGKLSLQEIPTSLIELFLPGELTPLLGSHLNGNVDVATSTGMYTVQLSSSLLSFNGSLQQKGDTLELTKPAKLTYTLTPAGLSALNQWLHKTAPTFSLSKPATFAATITTLQWPLKSDDPFYVADLSVDNLIQLDLHVEHLASQLYNIHATSGNALSLQTKLDLKTGKTDLACRLDQFPSNLLDAFVTHPNLSMVSLFGPTVNLTASTSLQAWSGPLALQLNAPNFRLSLNGSMENGLLTLSEPLYAHLGLTKELSKAVFNTPLVSHGPITLELPSATVSLVPFTPASLQVPEGHLELGKIDCHNEGNLNLTMGLLKLSQYSANDSLELWFAPLDFQISQGVMECERTEILVANNYQICSWGEVNFPADNVDMIVGLTASCLKKAFGIKDLPDNYVLQLPLRGTLDNVKIDTSKATSKIGMLLLWQQKSIAGSLGGGPAGAIAGKFLNKIGPLPDYDTKAPPPKTPFPWDQAAPSKKKKVSSHRRHVDPSEKPLKQLMQLVK